MFANKSAVAAWATLTLGSIFGGAYQAKEASPHLDAAIGAKTAHDMKSELESYLKEMGANDLALTGMVVDQIRWYDPTRPIEQVGTALHAVESLKGLISSGNSANEELLQPIRQELTDLTPAIKSASLFGLISRD